jgi:pimeloyl-ACP methyl ester carboxylesterase
MQRNIFPFSRTVLINYEVDGTGRIPVVFLHGFAASLVTWHDIRKIFPSEHFRLYLLDLKGFGFSSKPRDGNYGIADQAEIVITFIKAHTLRNAILIGHSFGGSVALQAALKSGQHQCDSLIGRLILLDCAAYPQRKPLMMRILRRPLLAWVLMRLFPTRLIVWSTLKRIFHNREAVTSARIRRYTTCFSRRGMAYVLIRTVRQLNTVESGYSRDYRTIKIPTLIIWGREDHITELWQAHRLHLEIEGSRLEILDECGHNPHEEYPCKTLSAIRDFIGE